MTPNQPARGASSLFEILRDLETDGYTEDVVPAGDGRLRCRACGHANPPAAFEATDVHRAEGASDPSDMVALVGVTCPNCGARGVVVAHYGPDATSESADLMRQLDTRGASHRYG